MYIISQHFVPNFGDLEQLTCSLLLDLRHLLVNVFNHLLLLNDGLKRSLDLTLEIEVTIFKIMYFSVVCFLVYDYKVTFI